VNIQLSEEEIRELVEVLGSAQAVFEDAAETETGLVHNTLIYRMKQCEKFISKIADQFNKQF